MKYNGNCPLRCKKCGRPLSQDEHQNFFSFCYDCFREFKESKMRKATAMRVIGIIGLLVVSMVVFMIFAPALGDPYRPVRPLRRVALIIGSTIALLVHILLIIFGTGWKERRKQCSKQNLLNLKE